MTINSRNFYDTYKPVQVEDTRGLAASREQSYLTLDSSLFTQTEESPSQDQDPSGAWTPRLRFSSKIDFPEKVDDDFNLGDIDKTATKLHTKHVRVDKLKFDVITYRDKDERIHHKLAKPEMVISQFSNGRILVTNKEGETSVGISVFKK